MEDVDQDLPMDTDGAQNQDANKKTLGILKLLNRVRDSLIVCRDR
jgi:hypothetical protein